MPYKYLQQHPLKTYALLTKKAHGNWGSGSKKMGGAGCVREFRARRGALGCARIPCLVLSLIVVVLYWVQPCAAVVGDDDAWHFTIAPYLWIPGQSGDVTVRGVDADVDLSVCDVLENLDDIEFAFMAHLEADKGRFGFYLDGFYMETEETTHQPNTSTKVRTQQSAIEFVGVFELTEFALDKQDPQRSNLSIDLLGGGRYMNLTNDVDLTILNAFTHSGGTRDWVDPLVGARATWTINEKWVAIVRGDIGGFDVGSQLTWNLVGTIAYRFNKNVALAVGYRWLDVDYEDGSGSDEFKYDVSLSGPFVGLAFEF